MPTTPIPDIPDEPMQRWVVFFPITYLILLITAPIVYAALHYRLPAAVLHPFGGMPLAVPWFGALGGLVISLQGIFYHNRKWNSGFNYWQAFAGVLGAIYGIFSYLFLVVVVKSASSSASVNSSSVVFALAAFTLGYAQSNVNRLITRVFDLLFQPSTGKAGEPHNQADEKVD